MSIRAILQQADIFQGLGSEQIELIASISTITEWKYGEVIFEESSDSDELYVIAKGEVDIVIEESLSGEPSESTTTTIATLRRGDSFGEIALVDRGFRSASARSAQQDTELVVIPRAELLALCESHPDLGYRLMLNLAADLAAKIRSADLRLKTRSAWTRV